MSVHPLHLIIQIETNEGGLNYFNNSHCMYMLTIYRAWRMIQTLLHFCFTAKTTLFSFANYSYSKLLYRYAVILHKIKNISQTIKVLR